MPNNLAASPGGFNRTDKATRRLVEIRERGMQYRDATVASVNREARTVELSYSSEVEYERWYGIEVLSHEAASCNLTRLNNKAPVLWNHDLDDQRGVIEPGTARIDSDRVGRCTIRLSRNDGGEALLNDIEDEIVTKVSVGYMVHGIKLAEERDDVDVYLVNAWEPYEVSLVSVPADDTVGVGRSAMQTSLHTRNSTTSNNQTNSMLSTKTERQKNPVAIAVEAARTAMGFREHFTPGIEEPKRIPTAAAGSATLYLDRALSLSNAAADVFALNMVPAGETITVDPLAVVAAHSRAAQAGARIIIASQRPAPSGGDAMVLYRDAALVRTVDPAAFALVADGADATVSAMPIHDKAFGWSTAPHYAFRVKVQRAQHRAVGGDHLNDAFMVAIMRGLGELADRLLLQAILAATPSAFSFGAVAARHAKFDEVRALVGTNGAGAAIAGDGTFRAAGVPAEMTAATTATVAGLFDRAAIAFFPELNVHVRRINAEGETELTVFTDAQAVVPNPAGDFWTVA